MNKEQLLAITIVIAATIAVIICWKYYGMKGVHQKEDPVEVSDLVYREEKTAEDDNVELKMNSFNSAKFITVEKVVRTTIENADGTTETNYDTYLVSDVDLVKKIDNTEDFSEAVSAEEYTDEKIKKIDFSNGFGFSYRGLSGLGVHDTLLEITGFDADFSKVSLDEGLKELTGENVYVFNEDSRVLDDLLPDGVELLEKRTYYQTTKISENAEIPDYYVAMVRYRDDERIVEKSLYLQITINEWEEV